MNVCCGTLLSNGMKILSFVGNDKVCNMHFLSQTSICRKCGLEMGHVG